MNNKYIAMLNRKFLILVGILIIFVFLYNIRGILLPFLLGFLIAYCFKNTLDKYENKISRNLLSLIIITVFSLFIVLLFIFIIPVVFTQLTDLVKSSLNYINDIDLNELYVKFNEVLNMFGISNVGELKQYFTSIGTTILKALMNTTNSFITSSFKIANILFMVCISPITAFYFLRDWNKMMNFIKYECIPDKFRETYLVLGERIDKILHHYVIGQISVSLMLGTYYSVLLFIIGFKYSFIVGLTAGFLTILPYVGAFGGGIIALVLAYLQFGFIFGKLLTILFIFCFGQFLEGNFVTPNFIGNKINVHPLWLFFSMFAGGSLYGFWGIVISMPIAAVFGVIIRFYFEEKHKNGIVDGTGDR